MSIEFFKFPVGEYLDFLSQKEPVNLLNWLLYILSLFELYFIFFGSCLNINLNTYDGITYFPYVVKKVGYQIIWRYGEFLFIIS